MAASLRWPFINRSLLMHILFLVELNRVNFFRIYQSEEIENLRIRPCGHELISAKACGNTVNDRRQEIVNCSVNIGNFVYVIQ